MSPIIAGFFVEYYITSDFGDIAVILFLSLLDGVSLFLIVILTLFGTDLVLRIIFIIILAVLILVLIYLIRSEYRRKIREMEKRFSITQYF